MAVIDCDQHLFEAPGMWAEYCDPADRDLAIALRTDDLGHTWVTWGDQRIFPAFRQIPGDTRAVGEQLAAMRRGEPATMTYDEMTPATYTEPAARLTWLDEHGLDEAMLFPNYGLGWERTLAEHLRAQLANMAAWNRWAVDVAAAGRGRLHPVGHVTLRDPDWLDAQLAALAAGGVRTAMTAPALVEGRRLSHPDLDRCWSAFEHHGVSPTFHVSDVERPFDDAWYEDDPDPVNPVLSSVFLHTAPALALADLAVHGTLARHPELRIGVVELSAVWVPLFLLTLDGGFDFHARFNGAPLSELELRPSEYVRRHVRVSAFAYEGVDRLMAKAGDLFMFCSDFPHSEGTATPLEDYERMSPTAASPGVAPGLYGDNAAWLLHQD